ncbi:class I SAM-dependent methyltransferase [Acidithiobacillus sp.]|uniref:class I SAM-dependent methyltransferase n=1 Tax=Acidithiobacillus sp. TaxID=1872118 RepID=UPI003D061B5F
MQAIYTDSFFAGQLSGTKSSATTVVPIITELFDPKSVVDVGCGAGVWLAEFHRRGVDTHGIDGDYVNREMLQIPQDKFLPHDLTKPLELGRTFDMAVSLEVAEHLPPESAEQFVALLTSLAPVVVFSAAIPGQGGVNHVNEQWQSYWAALFGKCGYAAVDCIRPRIWGNPEVHAYYAQNMVLYVAQDKLESLPHLKAFRNAPGAPPFDVVHPRIFQGLIYAAAPENIRVAAAARQVVRSTANAVRRRISPSARIRKPDSPGE